MKQLLLIVSTILLISSSIVAQDMAVTSTTPTDGANTILLGADITIEFDETLNPSSVNSNSITVVGSSSGNVSQFANYSVSGSTVTINPSSDFNYSETITVTVTTQVQDQTTPIPQDLPEDYVFTFTTITPPPVPSVVSTIPAKNAFNVDKDQVISITFDTTMAGNGFDEGVIKIFGSESGLINFDDYEAGDNNSDIDISATGSIVSIDLDSSLVYGETITVILTTGVSTFNDTRQDNGFMAAPYVWQFKVGTEASNALAAIDTSYTSQTSPIGIEIADMDNDGDADIVTANSGSNNVSVFYNDGTGTYSAPSNFSTNSTQPENLVLGDFNSDGFLDIAVSNRAGNDITVATSAGNGTSFSFGYDYDIGFAPRAITTADFNGDGKLDLAASLTSDDSVAVLINAFSSTNNGFFGPYKYEVGQGPIGIESSDLNNDGIMDLIATSHGTDSVNVLLGNGNGSFQAYEKYLVGSGPFSVNAGDLNNDGYADLISVNQYVSTVSVLINNNGSGFNSKVDYSVGTTPKYARLIDVNGDGDLDILTVDNGGTTSVTYLENAGDGTFSLERTFSATGGAFGFDVADLNNDGIPDFAVGSFGNTFLQTVSLYNGALITSTTPDQHSNANSASTNITVNFDNAISTSSLTNSTFIVEGSLSGIHTGSFSFQNNNKTIVFDPTSDFETGEIVSVSLTTGITDEFGNNIPNSFNFSFFIDASGVGDFANLANYTISATNTDNITTGLTADFNNDGYPDVVALDENNALLKVLFNDGDGTFDDASATINLPANPKDVKAADLDNDGDIDLLTANNNANGFSIIKNNGNSTFAARTDISYAGASVIALGDVDNDGDEDALLNNIGSNQLLTFYNNGSGNYLTTPDSITVDNNITDILVIDSDEDGYLDVITAHTSKFVLAKNDGSGALIVSDTETITGSLTSLAYGHVSGGIIFGASNSSSNAFNRFFKNTGTELSTSFANSTGNNPQGLVFADFSDTNPFSINHMDVVTANFNDSNFSLHSWTTNGSFFDQTTFSLPANPWDVATADFNNDGRMDVVTFNNNGQISVLFNQDSTPPTLSSISPVSNQTKVSLTSNISLQFSTAMDETTLDSNTVIVSGNLSGRYYGDYSYSSGNNTLTINPDSNFLPGEEIIVTVTTGVKNSIGVALAAPRVVQFKTTGGSDRISLQDVTVGAGTNPNDIKFIDLENDNDLDIIVANANSDSVSLLYNDGTGTFSSLTQLATGDLPNSIVSGDFDNANGLDFLVPNFNNGNFSVFLNNGSGTFTKSDYPAGSSPVDAVVADFDGDGTSDVIVLNRGASNASISLNTSGNGVFASVSSTVSLTNNLSRITAADIDNDKDIDIVVGGSGATSYVALNNGDGTFSAGTSLGFTSHDIYLSDIDEDGDVDLLSTDNSGNKLSIRLNDGTGSFGSPTDHTVNNAYSIQVVDFANDGDLDILVSNFNDAEVQILENNGSAVFSNGPTFNVGAGPEKFEVADLDGDGDLDFVTANRSSNVISINYGAGAPEITSVAASSILTSSATLNGSINAKNNLVDVKFTYKLTSAGTFTDTLNASPAQLVNGSSTTVTGAISGLSPNTNYTFKVFATDGDSTWEGSELSFNTASSTPNVLTESASHIGASSVVLNGQVSSQNESTTAYFKYGTTSGVYTDSVFVDQNPINNGLDSTDVTASLAGLNAETTYYFALYAKSSGDTSIGSEVSFTTIAQTPPDVTTIFSVTSITDGSAIISADIGSKNSLAEAKFTYKENSAPAYVDTVNAVPFQFNADTTTRVTATLSGLSPSRAYSFKPIASNQYGDSVGVAAGFVTLAAAPIVTTDAASSIADTSAVLNATLDTRNSSATVRFLYGTTSGVYTDSISVVNPVFSNDGNTTTANVTLDGLASESTYYVKAKATNDGGTGEGSEISFTTLGPIPTISSTSPTSNAVFVARGSDVSVTFTENMLGGSVSSSSFIVTGSEYGVYSGSYTTSGQVVTFNPSVNFYPGEDISVTLTTALTSAAGQSMSEPYSFSFVTQTESGYGTFSTSAFESYATGTSANEVHSGDLNNDGYLDIMSTYNGNIAINLNDGDGTFASTVSYAISGIIDVVSADLDNDGDQDLVAGTSSGLTLLFNNGSGTFGSAASYAGVGNRVTVLDIDADGDLDVITVDANSGPSVYLNNGSGVLSSETEYNLSDATYGVTFGDVDNDGDLDIIASRGFSGGVSIYPNNGDGTLGTSASYASGSQSQGVKTGDINGDGYIDVVVANYSSNNISVLINDGDGTFASAVNYPIGDGPYDVDLNDMDGDGDLDITTSFQVIDSVSISYNDNGSGTFTNHEYYLMGDNPRGVVAADFDRDGSLDIVTANNFGNNITVLRRSVPAPAVSSVVPISNAINIADSSNISITFTVPVNGDSVNANNLKVYGSQTGLVSGSYSTVDTTSTFDPTNNFKPGEIVTVTAGKDIVNTAGTALDTAFTFQFVVGSKLSEGDLSASGSITADNAMNIASVDLDGDGDLDIIRQTDFSTFYVHLNNGDGSFANPSSYNVSGTPVDFTTIDYDNDGDLDLIFANATNGSFTKIPNDGDGTFSNASGGFSTTDPRAVSTGDINSDGLEDLLFVNQNANTITVRFNAELSQFSSTSVFAVGTTPNDIISTDINNDGHMDVVVSNSASNNVSVLINDGVGSLNNAVNYSVGTTPSEVVASDVNADGYVDLLVSNSATDNVSVLINNKDNTFVAAVNYTVGDNPAALSPVDIDGDGDVDMLVANADSDNISILTNNGSGIFATATNYSAGDQPSDIISFDYDGDGDLDIFTSNYLGDNISILKRLGGPSVIDVSPSSNAGNISAVSNITVKFNTQMNSASLTSSTITVHGSLSGFYSGTVTYADSIATFDPTGNFEPGEEITVTVTTNVQSQSNEALEIPYSFEFRVASASGSVDFLGTNYSTSGASYGIISADFNNDGDNDVILTENANSRIKLFLNNGDGSLATGVNYTVGSGPRGLVQADVDRDNDLDVIVANDSGNSVSVLINTGGAFATAANYATGNGPRDVRAEDLNGDGYVDIITSNYSANSYSVLLNNGDGTFATATTTTGGIAGNLELADIDNDGNLDLIFARSFSSPDIQIIKNIGSGSFSGKTDISFPQQNSGPPFFFPSGGANISDLEVVDLNADNFPDIVVTDTEGDSLRVLLNDGAGSFTVNTHAQYSVTSSPSVLVSGDFDGDGDFDIAVAESGYNNTVQVLLNDGSGNLGTPTNFSVGGGQVYGITAADLDGDGQTDLALADEDQLVTLLPTPPLAAPSQATSLSFHSTQGTRTGMSATKGSATGMLFVMKQGGPVDFVPVNDVSYSPSSTFATGTDLGSGNYAVINATGGSTGGTVFGLVRNTTYHVSVFAYNTDAHGQITYATSPVLADSVTTLIAPNQEGSISLVANNGSQLRIRANAGNGTGRILAIREGTPITWTPSDSTTYVANSDFSSATNLGDGTKIIADTSGSGTEITITGLNLSSTYHFASFEYYGSTGTQNYYTTPATDSVTTNSVAGLEFSTVSGNSAYLDQTSDYSSLDTDVDKFPHNNTIEIWVKSDTVGINQMILSYDRDSLTIGIDSLNRVFATHINGVDTDIKITGTSTITKGSWNHIALVGESGSNLTLYVNGYNEASAPISDAEIDRNNLYIGTDYDEVTFFHGYVDELRVFKVARTQSEIRTTMHTTISGFATDMIGYWQFDGESGDSSEEDLISEESIYFNGDATRATPGAPVGLSTVYTQTAFTSGSANVGNATLSMADGFDSPVDIFVSEIETPSNFPAGYNSSLGGKYFIINVFGTPGTFSANLTLNYGANVIPTSYESTPDSLKLFKRSSSSDSSWTDLGGAFAVNSTTGDATWNGITSFSQFVAVGSENELPPATIWSFADDSVYFTKANSADWTQAANQDCITANVCITRQNNKGIFNIVEESSFGPSGDLSVLAPTGTKWAKGSTANLESLTFDTWIKTIDNEFDYTPPDMVDSAMVVFLEEDNIYIDIIFTSWSSGGEGGGFSYVRGGAAPITFDIQLANGSDVVAYKDSTYIFGSSFFDLTGDFADSTLTISVSQNLSGNLFIDQNSNESYDSGTDLIVTASQSQTYIPSGSNKLGYEPAGYSWDTTTVKLELGEAADSVSLEFFTVEGNPTIAGNSGENGWYLLANPFTSTIGDLLDQVWTQGAVNSSAPSADVSIYTFVQDSAQYLAVTTDLDTTKLDAGEGLLVYLWEDDDLLDGQSDVDGGWPKTLQNYGNPFGLDISVPVKNVDYDGVSGTSGSEGFVLFGNPYGWPLAADSVIATLKRADELANSYVYRWNPTAKTYEIKSSGAIQPYESVFIRVIGSGTSSSLSFDFADADGSINIKKVAEEPFKLMLSQKEGDLESEIALRFDENGSTEIDPYDGYYLGSYANKFANLYTLVGDQGLSINNLPMNFAGEVEYPIFLHSTETAAFNLSWDNEALPEQMHFYLENTQTGEVIDMKKVSHIDFNNQIKSKKALPFSTALNQAKTKQSVEPVLVMRVSGTAVSNEDDLGIPREVELYQNYPNPFNPSSIIRFGVPKQAEVQLEVFDVLGRKVMTLIDGDMKQPGRYNISFNARDLASGMYIYRLVIGEKVLTKKMMLIK